MRPMRRSLCVFSFLLLLLSAASVAQVGNTPRPAPTTRLIRLIIYLVIWSALRPWILRKFRPSRVWHEVERPCRSL